mgnify:CR=1 FL=1|jgi:hypothetical protein
MNKEAMFLFLDDLRESGITNMWGAGVYLQEVFEVTKIEARDVLLEWMKTFKERKTNGQVSA